MITIAEHVQQPTVTYTQAVATCFAAYNVSIDYPKMFNQVMGLITRHESHRRWEMGYGVENHVTYHQIL